MAANPSQPQPQPVSRRLLWAVLVPLVAGMLAILVWLAGRFEASQVQSQLDRDTVAAASDIRSGLSRNAQTLQALQATLGMTFFATSEWLVALQAPFIGNAFVGAAPSSYGSVTLRDGAKFSDGSPVTVEDVIWSMETLAEKGLPRYSNSWDKVARITPVGTRGIRFEFSGADSELPLLIGLRPILKKADWEGVDFSESGLRVPIGSGPYRVGAFEPGRFITFERNPDYWGKDLPINRGLNNFDKIRYDYFVDKGVMFQAFVAGELSVFRELNPVRWQSDYGFPAVASGAVVKSEIPHGRQIGRAHV